MSQTTPVRTYADGVDLGRALAADIADRMEEASASGRRFNLGCPGGRSPRSTYAALADEVAGRKLDLSRVTIVMMDDYVEKTSSGWRRISMAAHNSCRRFAHHEIQAVLNAGVAASQRIADDDVWVPDPEHPDEYERGLVEIGGLDFFILASGSGDGHVAFNPPGSPATSRTRVVELAEQTRRDNLKTFPEYATLDAVPQFGVTVGVATIVEHSAAAALILSGAEKHEAYARVTEATGYDPSWPASVVNAVAERAIYADVQAAGEAEQ